MKFLICLKFQTILIFFFSFKINYWLHEIIKIYDSFIMFNIFWWLLLKIANFNTSYALIIVYFIFFFSFRLLGVEIFLHFNSISYAFSFFSTVPNFFFFTIKIYAICFNFHIINDTFTNFSLHCFFMFIDSTVFFRA